MDLSDLYRLDHPSAYCPLKMKTLVTKNTPEISIVVPAFNEEETLNALHDALSRILPEIANTWEYVIVDDGSTDSTRDVIRELNSGDSTVRGIFLSRNFGHEAAIEAGIRSSAGDAVILMDADLQDSPDALPMLVNAWRDGADVAYAVRKDRKEGTILKAAFSSYYRFAANTMSIDLPRDAGPFCLMSRRAVEALNAMNEHGRYFPGLRAFVGFNQVAVPVERQARLAGVTKYSFSKRAAGALGAIFSFSKLPLRIATVAGAVTATLAALAATFLVLSILFGAQVEHGWPSLMITICFIGGLQLLMLGVIGEYVGKVYDEVRARPTFIVAEHVGTGSPRTAKQLLDDR